MIRRYSSENKPAPIDPNTLNIPTYWIPAPRSLSNDAGMHRFVWDLRPTPAVSQGGRVGAIIGSFFGGRGPTVLPGNYTIRLTANGKAKDSHWLSNPIPV